MSTEVNTETEPAQVTEINNFEATEPTLTTPEPRRKKNRSRFSLRLLEKRISAGFSILAKVFVISVILLAMIFVVRQLSDTGYAIRHVNMPVSFQEAGYTGPVVADRITSNLRTIVDVVRLNSVEFVDPSSDADVSVDLVGVGVPVRAFINLLGEAVGLDRSKSIITDITLDSDTLIVRTHVSGEEPEQFKIQMSAGKEAALKEAINKASYTILKYTAPDILINYNNNYVRDREMGIELSKFMLDRYQGQPYYEERAFTSWINSLIRLNKQVAAEEMLRKSLERFPESSMLYNSQAIILTEKGDLKGALEADKNALKFSPNARYRAISSSNIGYDFTQLKQSDSAIFYYQKALAFDPDFGMAYYNIGIDYLLLKSDTAKFLEYFEYSLEKHVPRKNVYSDPDIGGMVNDSRVRKLLEKYPE